MLIQFSVKNYRVFKDKAILSLVASNYDKETRENDNVTSIENFQLRLLKSSVIYGANASGKSKFLEALMFMKHFVISSSKETQKGELIGIESFRLSSETEEQGSEFEIIFLLNNEIYRYGFEADKNKVIAEWLFHKPKTKETEIFYRDFQEIKVHPRKFSKANTLIKENLVRDNALMLSVAAQFNEAMSALILDWFKSLKTITGLKEEGYLDDTIDMAKDLFQKKRILAFLKNADIGIEDFKLKKHLFEDFDKEIDEEKIPKEVREAFKGINSYLNKVMKEKNKDFFTDVITFHKKYDKDNRQLGDVGLSLKEDESSGTRKFFALTGQILKAIDNGNVLVIDELDSKLHPNLICKIISIFNSKNLNPNNAQLLFNTHDTNLLSSGLFRRDQIWFTEKDEYGAANLYSLADFKTDEVRKNEAFEENYIRGKYGAIPYLGNFDLLNKNLLLENEK